MFLEKLIWTDFTCLLWMWYIVLSWLDIGDLWSSSEGGVIKIWPWEAVEKSIHLTEEERHTAVLFIERSYVDLRNQLSTNGYNNMLTSDVKYLVSDNSKAKVWSAGYFSYALWWGLISLHDLSKLLYPNFMGKTVLLYLVGGNIS